jgi:Lrp/AsnC family leucine-responsive transcriptional regulator
MQINELDRIDYRILDRLQKDGRASNAELSEIAHLSPRVKRLEEAGMIDRYVAILNPGALGFGVTAFVSVTLGGGRRVDLQKFKEIVGDVPEILECHVVTGEADYLLKVVASDLHEFSRFLLERLMEHFDAVSTKSEVSLEQIKMTTSLPLATG